MHITHDEIGAACVAGAAICGTGFLGSWARDWFRKRAAREEAEYQPLLDAPAFGDYGYERPAVKITVSADAPFRFEPQHAAVSGSLVIPDEPATVLWDAPDDWTDAGHAAAAARHRDGWDTSTGAWKAPRGILNDLPAGDWLRDLLQGAEKGYVPQYAWTRGE
jgi:hypothetical protein